MTIENIAAEIVEKLPELVRDNNQNAQDFIAGMIKNSAGKQLFDCAWRYDEAHDYYDTQCGDAVCIEHGTLAENKYRFCPVCGGRISLLI